MSKNKLILWGGVAVVVIMFLSMFNVSPTSKDNMLRQGVYVSYSDFSKKIDEGEIIAINQEANSENVRGLMKDGKSYVYTRSPDNSLLQKAQQKNLAIDIAPSASRSSGWALQLFIMCIPILLLIAFMYWMSRKQMNEMRGMARPDKNGFKGTMMVNPSDNPNRLKDVAGCDEAKQEVSEIVDFLKNPEMYARVGARAPRGVLMSGPPGTGKTLLAKAIAGEAGVPFFSVSGSDFMEMFVGLGAARVRGLFEEAKKYSPSIIFIDEIDSIGRHRGNQSWGGNEEREQTLNALLVEMDGFGSQTGVVVIGATNRTDMLDQALKRPGRFDREVALSLPDRAGRQAILEVHAKNIPLSMDVSIEELAKGTPGFSGADLANLVNEAAVLAARTKDPLVTKHHFMEARDKIIMGVTRGPLKNEQERITVAYHEAGHAVVAHFTEGSSPVHKISIVPRGGALGVTVQLPNEESFNHSEAKILGDISIMMGGRAAEDVVLKQRTVGASNDFMRATVLARRIIASWGMDPDFGPISLDGERGDDWAHANVWSEDIKKDADNRVRALLKKHYDNACSLLRDNLDALHAVSQALLEKESLDGEDFEKIIEETLQKRKEQKSTNDQNNEDKNDPAPPKTDKPLGLSRAV